MEDDKLTFPSSSRPSHRPSPVLKFLVLRGASVTDVRKILQIWPDFVFASVENILRPYEEYLLWSKISEKGLIPGLMKDPEYFVRELRVVQFLADELKLKGKEIRGLLKRYRRILSLDIETTIKPRVKTLHDCGFSSGQVQSLVMRCPYALEPRWNSRFAPLVSFLLSVGLDKPAVLAFIARSPCILGSSINTNLLPKFRFVKDVMGRDVRELNDAPLLLNLSLEKRLRIRWRYAQRVAPAAAASLSLRQLFYSTDAAFARTLGASTDDYVAFKQEHLAARAASASSLPSAQLRPLDVSLRRPATPPKYMPAPQPIRRGIHRKPSSVSSNPTTPNPTSSSSDSASSSGHAVSPAPTPLRGQRRRRSSATAADMGADDLMAYLTRLGLSGLQIASMFNAFPELTSYSVTGSIRPKVEYLRGLGMSDEQLCRALCRGPSLLSRSLDTTLKPKVAFFIETGLTPHQVCMLVSSHPATLMYSLHSKIVPTLVLLRALGIHDGAIPKFICSGVFTNSLESIANKAQFYFKVMKGGTLELSRCPSYFGYSLKKRIAARFFFLQHMGRTAPLSRMLACTDAVFASKVAAATLEEYTDWLNAVRTSGTLEDLIQPPAQS